MNYIKRLLFLALLAPLPGAALLRAAEFEVLDRFSVDGYSVFRGSADISGGSFAVGGSTFVVKNGNVGIGTTGPGDKLEIGDGTAAAGLSIYGTGTGSKQSWIKAWDKAGQLLGLSIGEGNTEKISLNGNGNTFFNGGNVGISTVTPAAKLEIVHDGASTFGTALRINQGAIGNSDGPRIEFHKTMTASKRWSAGILNGVDVDDFAINEDGGISGFGTPRFTILNGGNVGIGTVTPVASLDVGGTGSIKIPVGSTAERPVSPANGMLRINTTTGRLEYYYGGTWVGLGAVLASGGSTVSDIGGYRIHTFTGSGTFTVTTGGTVEALVVAGGGGGGGRGGGGGAGGLLYSSSLAVPAGAYSVTVGGGGAGRGASDQGQGSNGGDSSFSSLTAVGGGGGGGFGAQGSNGGSGGGVGRDGGSKVPGSGASGQGNSGGYAGGPSCSGGGGGGGAGAVGGNGTYATSGEKGGNGGSGLAFSISGSSKYYAGGGGGGNGCADATGVSYGLGGNGGGGAGTDSFSSRAAVAGTVNTGGGGGAGGDAFAFASAAGGSGIVIIRYPN